VLQQAVHFAEIVAGAEDSQELDLDPRTNEDNRVRPIEETCTFQIDIKEEQVTQLSNQLTNEDKNSLLQVVRAHIVIFAWSAADMPRIDLTFHCHKLSIC